MNCLRNKNITTKVCNSSLIMTLKDETIQVSIHIPEKKNLVLKAGYRKRGIEMRNVVEIKELFKTIDKEEILSGINLQIAEGEIYGFLGPNGSGKTTLMKCMLSLSTITSGSIEIFGKNLQEHREEILSQIGSIIETPIFYENCTVKEILKIHAQYMGGNINESDIISVLSMVGLKNTTKKVKEFSLGMRQRLGLARTFLTKPRLLILDEPINGLDPIGIQEIRNLLLTLSKEHGITILISSHILSEISQIADRIGVIKNGEMIEQISMKEIMRENIDLEEYFMSHFLNKI